MNKKRSRAKELLARYAEECRERIADGELVELDVKKIKRQKSYPKMQKGYRDFVESSEGKVFVAKAHRAGTWGLSGIYELEGVTWMFWHGDLKRHKTNITS